MYLIVGLGNIGEAYNKTRHNAGFMFVDYLAHGESFEDSAKMEALILKKDNYWLVKPKTMMNDSGISVRKIIDFYKIETEKVVLVHDDLDLAFGEYKIQKGVGPKIHNGVKSVEKHLGTSDFLRVRIGIDNRQPGVGYGTGADYVLSKMSEPELEEIRIVIDEAAKEMNDLLAVNTK